LIKISSKSNKNLLWNNVLKNCGFIRNIFEITRYDVCSIASKVYSKALSAENLHAAFRKTGIYPFDPSGISNECVKPAEA
jgi:hypothetical protein